MKNAGWPCFSFSEVLRPDAGWKVDQAILATYSADPVVMVTALLALSGCDLDHRRTGSRVDLVRAIELLRGRVRVLTQAGRVVLPGTPRPILTLLDLFLRQIDMNELERSWHPKIALLRLTRTSQAEASDTLWRLWLGSRNLTRAMNWEAGLLIVSRADGRGKRIAGLTELGAELAARAGLAQFTPERIRAELDPLTWECPSGTDVKSVRLYGPALAGGFPGPVKDADRVFLVSPFLDRAIVRKIAAWGTGRVRRTLLSTAPEMNRLIRQDPRVFDGFHDVLRCDVPDLPAEGAEPLLQDAPGTAPDSADGEELPVSGLHAKLIYAAKGARRQLWLGSANATARAWEQRNFEVVAEVLLDRDPAEAIQSFLDVCGHFIPDVSAPIEDDDEQVLEEARKHIAGLWTPRQEPDGDCVFLVGDVPRLEDPELKLEVGPLGQPWTLWPRDALRIGFGPLRAWQRTECLQVRLTRRDKMCAWVQVAPFVPPLDRSRDDAVIAQYLDPRTFLLWLRSLLSDRPPQTGGGDWDSTPLPRGQDQRTPPTLADEGVIPTVEDILRAWARDARAFVDADAKVTAYLGELERRAIDSGARAEVELLAEFREAWSVLATHLR